MANDPLKRTKEILQSLEDQKSGKAKLSRRNEKDFIAQVAQQTVDALKPALNAIASQARISKADMSEMVSKISVTTHTPDVIMAPIEIPKAEVTVRQLPIKIPDIKMPDTMNVEGFVSLMGIDLGNPLPVQLRTHDGDDFLKSMANIMSVPSGGGGGKGDHFTIKGFGTSAFAEIQNGDGRIPVSIESGSTGLTDAELRAASVPVAQASGAIWSTEVTTIFGSTVTDSVFNSDNRIRVSVETGGSGLTDAELRAASVPVEQVSGSNWSTNVVSTVGLTDTELRAASVPVAQASGASWSTNVVATVGLTDTELRATAVVVDNSAVTQPISAASLPLPSGAATSAGQLADGHNVTVDNVGGLEAFQDTAGDLNMTEANSAAILADTAAIDTATAASAASLAIIDDWDATHSGTVATDGVQTMGEARITNPTAVSDGEATRVMTDKVGRQLNRPVQVRDLVQTAYVTQAAITEVVLLAGVSGVFHDMIYMKGANESDAAITLDIRQTTAGTVQDTLTIPANSTAGVALPVPVPQDHADSTWTVQNNASDNSNTVYAVTALFSKEI